MQNIINELLTIPTPCISDAMKGLNNFDPCIMPIHEDWKLAGRAFTVKIPVGDNSAVLRALQHVKEGDILVVDAKGSIYRAIAGDFVVKMMQKLGLGGFVTDGAVRDHVEIRDLNFPVFCKGVTVAASAKNGGGEINIPISCGGVTINPGDIIVGDASGALVVPQDQAEEVLKKATEKLEADIKRENSVLKDRESIIAHLKASK